MADPLVTAPVDPINPTTVGLINQGAPNTPVTAPYTPSTATPAAATTATYEAKPFEVAPNQTVASQIKDIIASGSPLMQQAETNAKNMMAQRGLINSSTAISAGADAVYRAAAPIAAQDAATFNKAAGDTVAAQNTALAADAAAKNTAGLQDAALSSDVSKFNSGQQNTFANLLKQISGQKAIADLQADTTLTAQDRQNANSQILQQSQVELNKFLGELSANTQLTVQDRATQASQALAAINNAATNVIANIQADTSLTIQQQQALSAQIIAGMNNDNARAVQQLQNAGNLANIQANGVINTEITNLTNANKTLLQTSQGAASVYNQALTNMASIITNPNFSAAQKNTMLNNNVMQLSDALDILGKISSIPGLESGIEFTAQY